MTKLPVPLPTRVRTIIPVADFSIAKTDNQFSRLISGLHRDYLLNVSNQRYGTAAILAGAICEVILYQLLAEHGVSQSLLKDDRSLGFKRMLDYIVILKLDKQPGFPLSQLMQIQKNRNDAIHANLLVNKERALVASDLEPFDQVIKYFGL